MSWLKLYMLEQSFTEATFEIELYSTSISHKWQYEYDKKYEEVQKSWDEIHVPIQIKSSKKQCTTWIKLKA